MPTPRTDRETTAGKSALADAPDAISLLQSDHREVAGWFKAYDLADSDAEKARLSGKICLALKVHARIEEEIFYPAAREALRAGQDERIDDALIEHAAARALIAEIEQMEVEEDLYDARIRMLGELIAHHVAEEETQVFPACRETDMDMSALGARLAARRAELVRKLARPNGHAVM